MTLDEKGMFKLGATVIRLLIVIIRQQAGFARSSEDAKRLAERMEKIAFASD